MTLQDIAKEAVTAKAKLDISNEGKKRQAFAYVNEKLAENKLTATDIDIDNAIEAALKEVQ